MFIQMNCCSLEALVAGIIAGYKHVKHPPHSIPRLDKVVKHLFKSE